jgi:hypothetical protein
VRGIGSISYSGQALSFLPVPGAVKSKITLPVQPADVLYASFKHIKVVSGREQGGIPLYKLTALDAMLDQLARSGSTAAGGERNAGPARIDSLLSDISRDLRSRLGGRFSGGLLPELGLVVDMTA